MAGVFTYEETFDRSAAEALVKYKTHYIEEGVEEGLFDSVEAAETSFRMLSMYLKKAKGAAKNKVTVTYNQKHGRGRYFADKGMSLQSMKSIIRGTIARDLYYDIDFVNCHPSILITICKRRGIRTLFLKMYVQDRDALLEEIHEANPEIPLCKLKSMILSIIYGSYEADKISNKTEWLNGFIRETSMILEKAPEWYPDEYKLQIELKGEDYYNLNGATLSSGIQVVENELLLKMVDFLKTKKYINKNCVLTFDGVMVPKKSFKTPEKLQKVMREVEGIFADSGYKIKLKQKEFMVIPALSDDVKTSLDQASLEAQEEELKIATAFTPREMDPLSLRDRYVYTPYYWYDFIKDMSGVHESFDQLCNKFRIHIGKVVMKVYEMDDTFIRKIDADNMFHFDKAVPKESFCFMVPDSRNGPGIRRVKLAALLHDEGLMNDVPCYDRLDFQPIGPFESTEDCKAAGVINERKFNTYTNLQAQLLPTDQVDITVIEPILHHIKKVWANDDEGINQYLLSWFHTIFTKPRFKSRVAIVLKSSEKQIGKGVIINDFLIPYVFGTKYSMSIAGLDTLTSRFNDIMMNKMFISCDELSTIEGGYHQSFDVLKKLITDPTIKIEIKNGRVFIYPNYSNYIMSTNHDFTIKIETGDARYLVLECNPYYKRNFTYFKKLADTFNQDTANHFYSYICHAMFASKDGVRDVRLIPMTNVKKDMIIQGLQPSVRFMLQLIDDMSNPSDDDESDDDNESISSSSSAAITLCLQGTRVNVKKVSAAVLYDMYKRWCGINQEKVVTSCKFGRDIKDHIKKMKSNGTYYDLTTFKMELE